MTKRSRTELGKTCQSTENTKVEVYLQRPKGLLPKEKDQTEINLCSFLRVVTEKKKNHQQIYSYRRLKLLHLMLKIHEVFFQHFT